MTVESRTVSATGAFSPEVACGSTVSSAGATVTFKGAIPVTISSGLTANGMTYNGTTTASLSSNNVVLSGVQSGDTANVALATNGYTASFGTAGVGSGKSVTVSGLSLTGSAAGKYILTQPTLSANITAAPVTISSGVTANNKPYDGTTTATISSNGVSLSGVIAGDTANVALATNGYTASFATASVGTGKAVTVGGLTLTGSAAGNYTLTQPSGLTANITALTVTISAGVTANNKPYDGTTTATISSNGVSLSGVIAGDTANVALATNGYTASFATASVGTGKAVTVGGLTLTGTAAGNYTLTQPSGLTANITALTVTISAGVTANNKPYDGTITATISSNGVSLSGVIAGDTANVALATNGYTASFATASVGTGKAVTVGGLTLTGSAAGNYTLTQPSGLTANITALTVTISAGVTANNKPYDGTTTATISSNGVSLSGVIAGDTANVALATNGYTASFATASVGTGKAVTVGGLTLTGSAAGNYTLTQPSGLTATITQANPTLSLVSSLNPSGFKAGVTFTATILTNGVTAGDATGTVQFVTNTVDYGGAVGLTAGAVSTNFSTLLRGANTLVAVYSGDGNYAGGTSSTLDQVVTNHPPAAATLTVTQVKGLIVLIPLSTLATNWSDPDGDPVTLTNIFTLSANGQTVYLLNITTNADKSFATNANSFIGYANTTNTGTDVISYTVTDNYGGVATGLVDIVASSSSSPVAGHATGISPGGSSVTAKFAGLPGYSFTVQRSTDLVTWTSLWTTNAPSGSFFSYTDTFEDLGGTPPASAYYRLSWNP